MSTLRELSHEPAASLTAGRGRAVRIFRVGSYSPADKAGLQDGDLLLGANGSPVASVDDLQRIMVLGDLKEVLLDVLRGDRRHEVSVRPLRM